MEIEIKDFILTADNFFTAEECFSYIKTFEKLVECGFTATRQEQTRVSKLEQDDTNGFFIDAIQASIISTSMSRNFIEKFWKDVYSHYRKKYAAVEQLPEHYIRDIKIQKTEPGEGYHIWHFENSDTSYLRRVLVYMVYLNDVDEGGETEFLYQGRRIKPRQGRLVLWPAGFTHLHRGNPPISNTKYIITGWLEV
jgi:hypothetical protein